MTAVIDERSLGPKVAGRAPESPPSYTRCRAVIAFDLAFAEPGAPEDDLALATAIRRSPARVVLGYFLHRRADDLGYRWTRPPPIRT